MYGEGSPAHRFAACARGHHRVPRKGHLPRHRLCEFCRTDRNECADVCSYSKSNGAGRYHAHHRSVGRCAVRYQRHRPRPGHARRAVPDHRGSLGVLPERVRIVSGDSQATPYGSGVRASRGTPVGGELALQASLKLKAAVLEAAAGLCRCGRRLTMRDGVIAPAEDAARASASPILRR